MAAIEVTKQAGTVGWVRDYTVVVLGDRVAVFRGDEEVASEVVAGQGRFVAGAGELKVEWGETADFEILYLYDKADSGWGYALNLTWAGGSEWGYSGLGA